MTVVYGVWYKNVLPCYCHYCEQNIVAALYYM